MRLKSRSKFGWAGALLIGAIAVGSLTVAMREPPPPTLPIAEPAVQAEYEKEVAAFLESNPEPQSADFDYSVDGRNVYWRALGSWWDSVPWVAVAGQWGCVSQAATVTFNPPDEHGVITAGRGGIGHCGGVVISNNPAVFSLPETRATIVRENPEDFD